MAGLLTVVVFGVGAIGGLFAYFLVRGGARVIGVGRTYQVLAVRNRGLRVVETDGSEEVVRFPIYARAEEVEERPDVVLLTVKAYDTRTAVRAAQPLLQDRILLLCLQNGLDVEKEARELYTCVGRGVTAQAAYREKPGIVEHRGVGPTIIGRVDGFEEVIGTLVDALRAGGAPAEVVGDIQPYVWEKTVINAAINPLGALTGKRNGELLEDPRLRWTMLEVAREATRVALAARISLLRSPIDRVLEVCRATAANKNSMLQDLERGRRTEIDYINGAVVRYGQEHRVPTPLNTLLTVAIHCVERAMKVR